MIDMTCFGYFSLYGKVIVWEKPEMGMQQIAVALIAI
jgi:hypothetical protein